MTVSGTRVPSFETAHSRVTVASRRLIGKSTDRAVFVSCPARPIAPGSKRYQAVGST